MLPQSIHKASTMRKMPLISQENILEPLTHAQRQAVQAPDGPALVIAGAGSGKTRTLTHRIAYLVANGARPSSIVALTFTNKAAEEMRERVSKLLSPQADKSKTYRHKNLKTGNSLFIGTFHGFAARILREDGAAIGLSRNFIILDEDESLAVMKNACKNVGINSDILSPKTARALVSRMKNEGALQDEIPSYIPQKTMHGAFRAAWDEYEQLLARSDSVDFDNLIGKTLELFTGNPAAREKHKQRISHILVDEYQDTNRPQYLLVTHLSGPAGNVFVVGDDWQAIYAFRGSDYRNILRFQRDWPDAKVYFLEENFRSTGMIVETANHLIAKNQYRTSKRLFTKNPDGKPIFVTRLQDEREEASHVISQIEEKVAVGKTLADIAIFFRTHAQSRVLEELCIEQGIPYRLVGGFKFYKRREIRDIIAYLRYISNPLDRISFDRIVNVPPRGIGALTRAAMPASHAGVRQFSAIVRAGRERAQRKSLSELLGWLLKKISYKEFLLQDPEEGTSRWENARELLSVAGAFDNYNPPEGLERFLETVSLLQDADEYDGKSDRLTLMTIHAAKGLEFPIVFLVGCEEGILPHANAFFNEQELEEERRLAYVAITRAKEELHLVHAKRRMRFGAIEHNPPSRFLADIPERLSVWTDQAMLEDENKIIELT